MIVYDPDLRKVDGVKKYSTSAAYNFQVLKFMLMIEYQLNIISLQFTPEKVGKHIVSVTAKDGIAVDGWPIPVIRILFLKFHFIEIYR